MHDPTCLLQGFWGQLKCPWIGMPDKASTTHQTHKCVLSSLSRGRALKKDQYLPHWNQGSDCWHLDKGAATEFLLLALTIHVWTVTQDTQGRECEIYVSLRHLHYICPRLKVVFSGQPCSPQSRGILCGILMTQNFMYSELYLIRT